MAPGAPAPRRWIILAAGLLVLAGVAAYHNSFAGPFLLDDIDAMVRNRTIRQLWPIWPVLSPPPNGETVSGRPLLNLSLAINYALGGLEVWGYHATNLAIHIAAALLLFGTLRRSLLTPVLRERFGRAAIPLALASTLIWTVHPLQTESVTYLAQRAESLAGCFYLLTLYCVIRGATGSAGVPPASASAGETPALRRHGEKRGRPWHAAAVLACLLGMATKEIMVTAPLAVLLYDRTFLSGSFPKALRRRWGLYVGLAATWGLLAYLVLSTGLIARRAEVGAPDPLSYGRSEPGVILHYLRLSLWPSPLCMGYEWPVANTPGQIVPPAVLLGALAAATVWGVVRRRPWGFLGAWFFLILLPTSSFLPLAQLVYEHRMYLSLAAVVVLVVSGGYVFWDRWVSRLPATGRLATAGRWAAPVGVLAVALLALGYGTVVRNKDYQSLLALRQDAVDKQPMSSLAHNSLAIALAVMGQTDEAIKHYQEALRLEPELAEAHNNLGIALASLGRVDEAIEHYQRALQVKPGYADAHNNLGLVLAGLGRSEEAIVHYQEALRLTSDLAEAHGNLGASLIAMGRTDEAVQHYHEALRLKPDLAEVHNSIAAFLARSGKTSEAIEHYRQAVRWKPDYAEAHNNLGVVLAGSGRTEEAIVHYQEALRLKPDYAEAHNNLGLLLAALGRIPEAIRRYGQALDLNPDYPDAHNNLGIALARLSKTGEAIDHFRRALRLKPDDASVHNNLGTALAASGKTSESIEHYQRSLELRPDCIEAFNGLAWLLATRETTEGGDATRAVQLAERARELAGPENAQCLDTLATAYAAAGRFPDAVTAAERAIQLAESTGQTALAQGIRSRLELYRAGRPYRENPK